MKKYFFLIFMAVLFSCGPSRFIQPLEEGKQAISVHLGGSLIDYNDVTIPIPLTSVTYANGLTDMVTVFGSVHTTSLFFNNLQLEVGVLSQFKKQEKWIPAYSSALVLNFITEMNEGNSKLWPQLDGNVFWHFMGHKNRLHIGYSFWIDPKMLDESKFAIFNPHIGYTRQIKNWNVGVELKFLAPTYDNSKLFIPYQSITGDRGANGIYLQVTKQF
jgi:hypothetical protein